MPDPTEADSPIRKLLEGEIKDPAAVMRILTAAISGVEIDPETVRQAVDRVLRDHEAQLRVFLVSQAKATLRSITVGMRLLDRIEEEWVEADFARIRGATNAELLQIHRVLSASVENRLDRVQKVVEVKREIDARQLKPEAFTAPDDDLQGLPPLSAPKRERVRRLLQAFSDAFDSFETEGPIDVEVPE